MSDHFVKITIGPEFDPYFKFTCTAPEGSLCRLWCEVPDCEGFDVQDNDGNYVDHETAHGLKDQGRCLRLDWLENDDPREVFMGEITIERSFELDWTGEGYEWTIAEALSAQGDGDE